MVACVAENRPRWARDVFTLALSLRGLGGRLARARMCAFFLDGLDECHAERLRSVDVECHVVPSFPTPVPQVNKLRMFERWEGEEVLVALDCDTVIVRDFSQAIAADAVAAMPALVSPLRAPEWRDLLSRLALEPDGRTVTTTSSAEELPVPYVNSGVLFVPPAHRAELAGTWILYVQRLLALQDHLLWPPRIWQYLDQIALACALVSTGVPMQPLGVAYNFPTNTDALRAPLPDPSSIRILHYHRHRRSSGRLRPSHLTVAEPAVQRVNRLLSFGR